MITLYQIAKRWRLSPRTVAKWVQSGRLKAASGDGRETYRFTATVVNAFHIEHGFNAEHMPLFEEKEKA